MTDDERTSVCVAIEKITGERPAVRYLGVDNWQAAAGGHLIEGWCFDNAILRLLEWIAPRTSAASGGR